MASPYTVPTGNDTAFDTIINAQSNNTVVHIGAGTFLTKGSNGVNDVQLADGGSLSGSGMGITTIKLANSAWSSGIGAVVVVNSSGPSSKFHGTVRDLTVDCNFGNQGGSVEYCNAIVGFGHTFQVENVELINMGSRSGEAFGVFTGNFDSGDVATTSHVIIRNCKVHKPWPDSEGGFTAFSPSGNNAWSGVIEGCYVDLTDAPDAGTCAYSWAGPPQGFIIAHNTAIGAKRGVHVDTPGSYAPKAARSVIISNNRFYNCTEAIGIGAPSDTPEMSDHFENFIIESNSIEMLGDNNKGIALWGSTKGFIVQNNTIMKNPGAGSGVYRKAIYVSSGSEGHIVKGNRFGPTGDSYFEGIDPSDYDSDAAKKNTFEDNSWTGPGGIPKTIVSARYPSGGSLPTGSSLWGLQLGSAQNDANPATAIWSSDLDGSDGYDYMLLSRANGGIYSGFNTILDPSGESGVFVGDDDSGNLRVGGWITPNSGLFLPSTASLAVDEAGGRMGAATLSSGQVTVNTSQVAANSRIFLTIQQDGGTPGAVRVSSRTAGTSFVITSTSATDASTVAWLIVSP